MLASEEMTGDARPVRVVTTMETSEIPSKEQYPVRIAHLSDVHFGRIAHPAIVEAIIRDVNTAAVDLVVVSGDFTQRARPSQYRGARRMLESFAAPWLAVPGNHDVFAWWHPLSRLFDPLRRYRRWITDDLTPSFESEGLGVLGINSAFGWTVKGGRISETQRDAMRSFFGGLDEGTFRVLVVHHHLTHLEALGRHDLAREAAATPTCAAEFDVDLVLCGHLHVSHVSHLEVMPGGHGVVVASAGTATSDRGRKPHKKTNFYNHITVSERSFEIAERQFEAAEGSFEEVRRTTFDRV